MGGVGKIDQGVYVSRRMPFVSVRTTRASRHPYAAHFHDTLSIGVVFAGGTVFACAGESRVLAAGDMVVIAPGEVHSCNPLPGGSRGYHMVYLCPEWAAGRLSPGGRGGIAVANRVVWDAGVFSRMMDLAESVRSCEEGDEGVGVLEEMIGRSCRWVAGGAGGEIGREMAGSFSAAFSVAEMARRAGVARETFIRSFRRETGTTPGRYRQGVRLQMAARLLREGAGIADVAARCGFSDQSHLHRMCVKYLSATPAQLRCGTSLSFKK